ncbi:MAG: hypothetical protein ABSC25_00045 [Roseiarcus sp.]
MSDGVRGAEVRRPRRAERPFRGLLLVATLLGPALAQGAEPSGCDKFKWPLAHERSALSAPDLARLEPGAALSFDAAARVRLAPLAEAKLAMAPERAPKASPSWAGAIELAAPAAAGTYKVSLSGEGWIDVVQEGRFVKPVAFSGALDCPSLRKSVKFPLEAEPLTIQLSDVKTPEISLIVSPE